LATLNQIWLTVTPTNYEALHCAVFSALLSHPPPLIHSVSTAPSSLTSSDHVLRVGYKTNEMASLAMTNCYSTFLF